MKLNLLCLLAIFTFIGCGPPEFERNTRILVKGIVVDQNNTPISNINIDIYTERSNGIYRGREYLLGRGLSNEEGAFSITSLFDRDEDFQIEIYAEQSFSTYFYRRDTENYPRRDLTYDLKTVTLNKLAEVKYNISRTSPPNTELRFSFQFKGSQCFEVFDDNGLNLIQSNCLEEVDFERLLTENNPSESRTITTLLGSTVKFTYAINNGPEIVDTFIVDREDYEFNFSY